MLSAIHSEVFFHSYNKEKNKIFPQENMSDLIFIDFCPFISNSLVPHTCDILKAKTSLYNSLSYVKWMKDNKFISIVTLLFKSRTVRVRSCRLTVPWWIVIYVKTFFCFRWFLQRIIEPSRGWSDRQVVPWSGKDAARGECWHHHTISPTERRDSE